MVRSAWFAGVVLALSMAASASAQFGGRGMQLPPAVQNIMLLRTEAVQKELNLNEDQTSQIGDLATQMQTEAFEIFSGLQDLNEEERKAELPNLLKMMNEKGKELQKKVDKVLDPKQTARMRELSLQKRDVAALGDEEIIAALKLSDDQKQKLAAVQDEAATKQQEIVQELLNGGGDRSQIRPKMEALRKELGAKALAVLTDQQRAEFEKLKGAKFEFPAGGGFPF